MPESKQHLALKRAAGGWLRAKGFVAVADEIYLPAGGFRADVAVRHLNWWWAAADGLWIAAPIELLGRPDILLGWGLLEADRSGMLRVTVAATQLASTDCDRGRILRGVAVAASRARWTGATQLPLSEVALR